MRLLVWLALIVLGIYVWSQSDPQSFQDAKDKLKDQAIQSVLKTNVTNITNQSLVIEQNFTEILNGTYPSNTVNYGRPKKIVEFLCTTDKDCKTFIPSAPQDIRCNKSTGECIKE